MKITFLGTRGYIKIKNKKHKMHTSTLFIFNKTKLLIDCGQSWKGKLKKINPDYIIITHAHPDHAFALEEGSFCPVYATKDTWKLIKGFPIKQQYKKILPKRKKIIINDFEITAYPVIHSIKAPAVGLKIKTKKTTFFYVPDVAWITNRKTALKNIDLYIGDGACVKKSLIRRHKETNQIFGHASVFQQISWCNKENIKQMIITHCGTEIVKAEKTKSKIMIDHAKEKNIKLKIAYDNMKITLP